MTNFISAPTGSLPKGGLRQDKQRLNPRVKLMLKQDVIGSDEVRESDPFIVSCYLLTGGGLELIDDGPEPQNDPFHSKGDGVTFDLCFNTAHGNLSLLHHRYLGPRRIYQKILKFFERRP